MFVQSETALWSGICRHGWTGFTKRGKLKGDKCGTTALAALDQFDITGTTGMQGDTASS